MGEVSDGYHTFNELYYYRMLYNAAFFNLLPKELVHKSKRHHTGEECFGGGWFIVMANLPTGQISNHYELKDWDLFKVPEKEFADEWDGHTPQEAAERLHKYLQQEQPEVDLGKEIDRVSKRYPEVSFAKLSRIAVHFAKWKEAQDQKIIELAEDHAYLAGAVNEREKMMKEAIHYVVQDDLDSHGASYNIPFIRIGIAALKPKGIGVGDKVRIIIVKED